MAITKIQSESLNLADTYAFTGTVTGAGESNVPAFQATMSGNQNISDNTYTKVNFDTETFDTNSAYDHSSNYRFTPQVAGKYLIYAQGFLDDGGNHTAVMNTSMAIYKNGSSVAQEETKRKYTGGLVSQDSTHLVQTVVDLNGSSDYVEAYIYLDYPAGFGVTQALIKPDGTKRCAFGGFLLTT